MKRFFNKCMAATAILVSIAIFSSCEDDNGSGLANNDELYESILKEYVSSTIMPTYKSLAEAALEMRAANETLKTNPTDATMKAASDAWMKARICWELSEAFLFGPVGDQAFDIDGHIDSWPLELEDIKRTLEEDGLGLTGAEAWRMEPDVIGFHVTEYLLYRDGQSRPASDLSTAELNYLTAATDALVWDCVLAYIAWMGEDNVPTTMIDVFNENPDVKEHLNSKPEYMNFAEKLTTASGYPSWGAALEEITTGIIEIADEVGTTKIEAPYEGERVEDVESWYSWHSLDDYTNNIYSIKNAYLGGIDDNTRTSLCLSTYVAMKDQALDAEIKSSIENCITKIRNIGKDGQSFYEVVKAKKEGNRDMDETVSEAVEACEELSTAFKKIANIIE